ncbi:hypothetical protein HAX54_033286, partial [Datura stramonium]|nr:hypothetical protein [Datura stramonium]
PKDRGREWKKVWKGQAAENEGEKGRQGDPSYVKKKFGGCYMRGGPHLRKDCPLLAKVNEMVAAEEGKKAEPKAKDTVAYEDDILGSYRVIVPDPNRRVH